MIALSIKASHHSQFLCVHILLLCKGELFEVTEVQPRDGCLHGYQSSVSAQLQREEDGQQASIFSEATRSQLF